MLETAPPRLRIGVGVGDRDWWLPFEVTIAIGLVVAAVGITLPFLYSRGLAHALSAFGRVWSATGVLALLFATMVVSRRTLSQFLAAIACCLLFFNLSWGPASDTALGYVWSKNNAAAFQTALRIESLVDSGVPWERTVRFWYDAHEPSTPLFDSTYSLYLWGYFDFTKLLPSTSVSEIKRLVDSKTTFAHLTVATERTSERTRLLSERGIQAGNERSWIIPSYVGEIHLVLQDVLDDSNLH
jgi:hypothetical protein